MFTESKLATSLSSSLVLKVEGFDKIFLTLSFLSVMINYKAYKWTDLDGLF
jgi:hypothetical protein